jgi:hypothetical protein
MLLEDETLQEVGLLDRESFKRESTGAVLLGPSVSTNGQNQGEGLFHR